MEKLESIRLFEEKQVRTLWDEELEKWFVSVVDVIEVLTESVDATAYWRKLKQRLKAEGNETVTNCHGLKMKAKDGKMRLTDVADAEQLFRLIQSIPSPKAEPFKLWLARLGKERLDEMADPELGIDKALEDYANLGYSQNWINQRLKSIEIRKELTDEWKSRGIKEGMEFATLTNIITKTWSDKTTKEYKVLKGLKQDIALGGDINIIRADVNGIFLSYYLNTMAKDGIEVFAPKKSYNGTEVPSPRDGHYNGTAPRRFLPHVDLIGYYQFVTFRTHDSLDDFIKRIRSEDISSKEQEYKIDQYIDTSSKGCYLNDKVLEYLRDYFIEKDKSFYDLVSFVIMPNHVHILFKQNIEISKIMQQIKGATSFEINKRLHRKGKFWEANYYDKVIWDEAHFAQVHDYIKYNGIKAGLKDVKGRFYGIYE